MATNTEMIRELDNAVADIKARLEAIGDLQRKHDKLADEIKVLDRDLSGLKPVVANLDRQVDRMANQRFTIFIAVVSALVGGVITFLAQLGLKYLAK